MLSATDIVYVLSGGASNVNPNNSLGGNPSSAPILGNTLFDDVTEAEAISGRIDYRCFYVFNNNGSDSLYNTIAFLTDDLSDGATSLLGILTQNETQEISITGSFSGGSFSLSVMPSGVDAEPVIVSVACDTNQTIFADNLQNAINVGAGIDAVAVSVAAATQSMGVYSQIVFHIVWGDNEVNRYQELLSVSSNSLTSSATISIDKVQSGSPINVIADAVDFSTTAPNGITFAVTTSEEPVEIGTLRSLDGFPAWVQRTVAPNTTAVAGDGFIFQMNGQPIVV